MLQPRAGAGVRHASNGARTQRAAMVRKPCACSAVLMVPGLQMLLHATLHSEIYSTPLRTRTAAAVQLGGAHVALSLICKGVDSGQHDGRSFSGDSHGRWSKRLLGRAVLTVSLRTRQGLAVRSSAASRVASGTPCTGVGGIGSPLQQCCLKHSWAQIIQFRAAENAKTSAPEPEPLPKFELPAVRRQKHTFRQLTFGTPPQATLSSSSSKDGPPPVRTPDPRPRERVVCTPFGSPRSLTDK